MEQAESLAWCCRHGATLHFRREAGWDYVELRVTKKCRKGEPFSMKCQINLHTQAAFVIAEMISKARELTRLE